MTWTPEKVKDDLPNVKVKFPDGHTMLAMVSGRKLKFAGLHVRLHEQWLTAGRCSWETLARVLNNGSEVIL